MEQKAKSVEEKNQNNNLMNYMVNPRLFTLRKWIAGILKDKYPQHDAIIERISVALVTQNDLEAFGKMIGELYHLGYLKAVDDYRKQLEKHGVKITIGQEEIDINQ